MIKFITNNNSDNNHLKLIKKELKTSKQSFFAIAFLKTSGIDYLLKSIENNLKSGGHITIIAGQNFALTEPKALIKLHKLFKSYPNSNLYLAKAKKKNKIFHPKLYLFNNGTFTSIISGSANITKGGLIDNRETSLLIHCKETDRVWIDALTYFNTIIENSNEATMLVIKQYETFFKQQKKHNEKSKPIPSKNQFKFNYVNLLKHLKKFDINDRENLYKKKSKNYDEAKKILNQIVDIPNITQKQFEPLLDKLVGKKGSKGLWYSGSLHRKRKFVYKYYKEFQNLVKYIRTNRNQPAENVFNNGKIFIKKIKGAGINYLTEIMITYNRQDFANLNDNPLTVLSKEAGVNLKTSLISFKGKDYDEYCELVKEISLKLKLKDMLEADSFFNEIYWKIKNKTNPNR